MSNDNKTTPVGDNIVKFLTDNHYRYYQQKMEYPYVKNNLYQKSVKSNKVCETSGHLSITIQETAFVGHENNIHYTVDITAEQGGLWWKLEVYSLSQAEFIENLEAIENNLISFFNSIKIKNHGR